MDAERSVFFMGQSYRVFYENRCLNIFNRQSDSIAPSGGFFYSGIMLPTVVNEWLNGKIAHDIDVIGVHDPVHLLRQSCNKLEVRYAAGGVVFFKNKEVLFIERNGYYDLPKGHLDPNETFEEAAVRETMEETGIKKAEITVRFPDTWHCYIENQTPVLKYTRWYAMKTDYKGGFQPQQSEGIRSVFTVKKEDLNAVISKCFRSVKEILGPVIRDYVG